MRIGILTLFHKNYNWGGVLQGYALKEYIEKSFSDTTVDLIKYHSDVNVIYSNKLKQAMQYSPREILLKLFHKLNKKNNADITPYIENRIQLFDMFMEECTTNIQRYDDNTLSSISEEYDCLICGSDQIWNPNVARPGYFLAMIGDECIKASYAASIAREDLTKIEKKIMIPLVENFDFISVREKTAQQFLQRYTSANTIIEEVLDPAFLLTKSEWDEMCNINDKYNIEEYALAFFFSESKKYREIASSYCKEKKLKLVYIPFAKGVYISSDMEGAGERFFDVGPKEFVGMLKNASCIVTDSFHGTVFSIIYHKQFCVFERDRKTKVSKNSRLYDLLNKFGLSDRLISDCSKLNQIMDDQIDYIKVDVLLDYYRKQSKEFLQRVLESVKK